MAGNGCTTDVDVAGGVTTVQFDDPPVNALGLELLDTVVVTMQRIVGPVVITGAGKCFSAGVDLRAIVDGGPDYTDRFVSALSAAFLAVFDTRDMSLWDGDVDHPCGTAGQDH